MQARRRDAEGDPVRVPERKPLGNELADDDVTRPRDKPRAGRILSADELAVAASDFVAMVILSSLMAICVDR